jgi:hypothetical protein
MEENKKKEHLNDCRTLKKKKDMNYFIYLPKSSLNTSDIGCI